MCSDREIRGRYFCTCKNHKRVCFQKYASLRRSSGRIISNWVNLPLFLQYIRYFPARIKLEQVKWPMLQSTSKLGSQGFVGGRWDCGHKPKSLSAINTSSNEPIMLTYSSKTNPNVVFNNETISSDFKKLWMRFRISFSIKKGKITTATTCST